jgi:hypothetical protein
MQIRSLQSLTKGFFSMAIAISIFCILNIFRSGDAWLGALYSLILLIPLFELGYIWKTKRNTEKTNTNSYQKWSHLLFALQGAALACWAYDLATTFYAIDIARVAYEVNPLGWPLGALGAFAYYVPTIILTYILLFRIKQKTSIYAAVPVTAVALFMGSMNLNAGIGNFQFFVTYAWLPLEIRYSLLATILAVDLVCAATVATSIRRHILNGQEKLNPLKKSFR